MVDAGRLIVARELPFERACVARPDMTLNAS